MFLALISPNYFNHLLIVLSKQLLHKRIVHIKRSQSVITGHHLNKGFQTFFCKFQHVVLVGGFASNDWLFSKVYESLTPFGLNIVRPENHVWVLFKVKTIVLFKKYFIETKLLRMARSHSISTTSWELAFPKSHMVPFAVRNTTQVTQITDRDLTRFTSIFSMGVWESMIFSISSYPKWAVYSLFSKVCS